MTYTRSPEAVRRDEMESEFDNTRAELEVIRAETRRIKADADKYAAHIRAEYADMGAMVDDAKREAARITADAHRMRAAAKRYMDRKASERPVNPLLAVLVNERYGT